jgi:hypothetical protein
MISCKRHHLELRAHQRGYTLDEVRPCIVSEEGDTITVDETHPAYPRVARPRPEPPRALPPPTQIKTGAGTELKKLLGKIGIKASPSCSCNKRAITMDNNGIEWCENNIDTIVGWLKEEATKRKLPFIDMAGRILVKRAISNAKKNAQ